MENYVLIDAFNHVLIAASVALSRTSTEEDFQNMLSAILLGMIQNLKKKFNGKYYVCWDSPGGTAFRKEKNPSYKANRDHSKINFKAITACSSLYETYGMENVTIPECEADDLIFVLSQALREQHPQACITVVSRDKDLIQIVQAGYATQIWDPVKKQFQEIPFYSIVEWKALVGDKSDSISGVDKIGEKTALRILSGNLQLTESQRKQYEECLELVDATKNPNYLKNLKLVKAILQEGN